MHFNIFIHLIPLADLCVAKMGAAWNYRVSFLICRDTCQVSTRKGTKFLRFMFTKVKSVGVNRINDKQEVRKKSNGK